jgi:hypothetical protein
MFPIQIIVITSILFLSEIDLRDRLEIYIHIVSR